MVAACVTALTLPAAAASLPPGFSETVLFPAQTLATAACITVAPDGRIFVCQRSSGALRVIDAADQLLPTPFLTLNVDTTGERGMLGVAFDPNFAVNNYVYVYYTAAAQGGIGPHNRISRFTASGNTANPATELILWDFEDPGIEWLHNGGSMVFGLDGKMYVGVGDAGNPPNGQSLTTRFGKILRINTDAYNSIPTDNPFYNTLTGLNRAIWAYGLRHPYSLNLRDTGGGTSQLLINDVGRNTYEEINAGQPGGNYGWSVSEGPQNIQPGHIPPLYYYAHGPNETPPCAITGGAFYLPQSPSFPASYVGKYFFTDYCTGEMSYIDPTLASPTATVFATGLMFPAAMAVRADGRMYYISHDEGTVFRFQYDNAAPSIVTPPANRTVLVGQSATFTVTATGPAPLSYQWQRNGSNISGATSTSYTFNNAQPSDDGAQFRVVVSNNFGSATSSAATLSVTANAAPVATITAPAAGSLYTGGMVMTYGGTGSDAEDGTLPPSAFTWQIDFHHDQHTHPVLAPTSGITGGTFSISTNNETETTVFYRIYLTVTDSGGRTHQVFRDVQPQIVQLTLATNPPGLALKLDNQVVATPTTFGAVVGIVRTIEAETQVVNGVTYTFSNWSDGGAAAHVISTPSANTTFTATFAQSSTVLPPTIVTPPADVHVGTNESATFTVSAGGTPPLAYQWTSGGIDIPGAQGASYTHPNAQLSQSGLVFRVRVSNSAGSVTSAGATLTVTVDAPPRPTITAPVADASVLRGDGAGLRRNGHRSWKTAPCPRGPSPGGSSRSSMARPRCSPASR